MHYPFSGAKQKGKAASLPRSYGATVAGSVGLEQSHESLERVPEDEEPSAHESNEDDGEDDWEEENYIEDRGMSPGKCRQYVRWKMIYHGDDFRAL